MRKRIEFKAKCNDVKNNYLSHDKKVVQLCEHNHNIMQELHLM